jgi:hypothetical protein
MRTGIGDAGERSAVILCGQINHPSDFAAAVPALF